MATVLLASELGGGRGHLSKLLTIGTRLQQRGHRLVLSAPDLPLAAPFARGDVLDALLQSPLPRSGGHDQRATTYCDILSAARYTDEDTLAVLLAAWERLLSSERPSLVIADHAPTAVLACAARVPAVVIGTGFTVPPVGEARFPALAAGPRRYGCEDQLLPIVHAAYGRLGRSQYPPTLPAAIAGAERFVCCSRELDPYAAHRTPEDQPIGPLNADIQATPAPPMPRFLAYLTPGPHLEPIVAGLVQSGIAGALHVRGTPRFVGQIVEGSRVQWLEKVRAAADVLPGATLVVHHGGTLSEGALAAGRPQLLAPLYLEQELTARALTKLGVGRELGAPFMPERIAEAVRAMAADGTARQAAMLHAERRAGAARPDPAGIVARACEALLQRGRTSSSQQGDG